MAFIHSFFSKDAVPIGVNLNATGNGLYTKWKIKAIMLEILDGSNKKGGWHREHWDKISDWQSVQVKSQSSKQTRMGAVQRWHQTSAGTEPMVIVIVVVDDDDNDGDNDNSYYY